MTTKMTVKPVRHRAARVMAFAVTTMVMATTLSGVPASVASAAPVAAHHHDITPAPAPRYGTATVRTAAGVPNADPAITAATRATAVAAATGVHWPAAATTTLMVPASGGMTVPVAGMPVRVGAATPARPSAAGAAVVEPSGGTRVRVDVAARAVSSAAGIDGIMVGLGRADPGTAARTSVSLDYSSLRNAGGDFASRLQLVALPACALTTPTLPRCQTRTPVPFHNDLTTATIAAQVTIPAAATALGPQVVLAATTAPTSGAGSYTATSLSASSTWQSGGNSGDFSWSYPLRVPPANGGPAPGLSINYDSQSLDGRLPADNNQPSWVGDGFDLSTSYIERTYGSCADDGQTGKYDDCWKYDNATMVLNGSSTELIKDDATGMWRPKTDDGSRIVRSTTGSATKNGDNDGETWTVTTTDGTQYVFGLNQLPGWVSGDAVTNSVWTVPVYGDDAGEPCHASTFATSSCMQAWRWNLDYVVDPNGNTETYWYTPEYNYYAQNGVTTANGTKYTRGGYLSRIDYGQTSTDIFTAAAPEQVAFTTSERCVVTTSEPCTTLTSADQADWPDVPFDEICASGTNCNASQAAPTFFSRRRLTNVTTQYWTGTGTTYQTVDSWDLVQSFPATGDGTAPPLWLNTIKHTGDVGTAIGLNTVSFGGIQLTNRVDTSDDSIAALVRWRVRTITSETGAVITVNYMTPECVGGTTMPAPDSNTKRCFPSYWTMPGATTPRLDWFQKYPVAQVLESDPTGGDPTVETDYAYAGAAWHYDDDNGISPAKYKTWSNWRGYASTVTTVGAPTETQTDTKTLYFQGMDGDKLSAGGTKTVKVTDSHGTQVTDAEPLAGQARETITYNGVSGAEVSGTITDEFLYQTAAQLEAWGTSTANIVRDSATHIRTDLAAGGVRTAVVSATYDTSHTSTTPATGLPLTVDDSGDTSITGDEQCTRTTYAQNPTTWLMDYPDRVETVAVACAATPNRPTDVMSDARTLYDGGAFGAAPTTGNVTSTQRLASYSGSTPIYQTMETTTHDGQGRPLVVTDALMHSTTTAYTPATGGPLTQTTVTNAKAQVTTTTVSPAWGTPTAVVDPNNKRADLAYDALGRLVSVWQPTRSKALNQNPNIRYVYTVSNIAPSTVTIQSLNNDGSTYLTTSITFYDATMQTRQTQTPAPGGGRLITQTDYNSLGQATETDGDYSDATAPSTTMANVLSTWPQRTTTGYDGVGRAIASTLYADNVVNQVTTTTYGGDRTTITPPAGGSASTTISDIRGNVVENDQYNSSVPTGSYVATTYTYTPGGEPKTLTDAAGNVWSDQFNLLGRQTDVTDPDSGHTHTDYDAAGNIADTIDAMGNEIQYGYDELNRQTSEYVGATKSSATEVAAWLYDTVAKGELTSSTRYVGGTAGAAYVTAVSSYDALYRPAVSKVTIPSAEPIGIAGSYTSTAAYNLDGTLQSQSLPAGGGLAAEAVTFTYNSTRQPIQVQGNTGLVQNAIYTKLGQLAQVTLGVSPAAPWVQTTNTYDDGTDRLHNSLVTDDTNPTADADSTYTYDSDGNTTEANDTGSATDDNQCFSYDGQGRLQQAWTTTSTCPAGPSTGILGGPAPYWLSWSYDTHSGLRSQQVNHAATGISTVDYGYPAAGANQPHALQTTSTTGAGAGSATYGYNTDGQTISRPGTTAQQTLGWNAEGDLASITEGTNTTSNLYGPDGNLLISHGPTETVLYLAGEQIHLASGGTLTCQREFQFDGQSIALRTNSGLTWLVADPHNTSSLDIDATTQAVTHRYETPFDTPRGTPPGAWPDSNGFLDKPYDPTIGLTYLGAREYDQVTGRFLSVDPNLTPTDPQSLAAYTYAGNAPTSAMDPTGLTETPCADDGPCGSNSPGHPDGSPKGHDHDTPRGDVCPSSTNPACQAPPPAFHQCKTFNCIPPKKPAAPKPVPPAKPDPCATSTWTGCYQSQHENAVCTGNKINVSEADCFTAFAEATTKYYKQMAAYNREVVIAHDTCESQGFGAGCSGMPSDADCGAAWCMYPEYDDPTKKLESHDWGQVFISVSVCVTAGCASVTLANDGISTSVTGGLSTPGLGGEIGYSRVAGRHQGTYSGGGCAEFGVGACLGAGGTTSGGYYGTGGIAIGLGATAGATQSETHWSW